ncbi:MAG: hypothetical protein CYPHOPRED_001606 [Cyphobasidiales sp. Tagirdzhanova-0007]|nr:MAG: hypothetical protein CYPHOPRED_001606 [Cyphobasidiales sp. Tagirdzhanova-0007]
MSSSLPRATLLITPAALSSRLGSPNLRILDATWCMPGTPRDPAKEFLTGPRIQGAAGFWDVDDVADKGHPLGLKHMLPDANIFANACSKLGIEDDSEVIVYDTHSVFSSPRTAFTFKAFAHRKVSVLDGGLPRWIAEGLPIEESEFSQPFKKCDYPTPALDGNMIRSYEQVTSNTQREADSAEAELVLDARPAGRFTGSVPEPRPGLSSGHMPHSVSLPFNDLRTAPSDTTPPYQSMLSAEALRQVVLKALGGDSSKLQEVLEGRRGVINSCGSGMTAAVIWLALQELGVNSSIYDESWTGYAMRHESKILKDQ